MSLARFLLKSLWLALDLFSRIAAAIGCFVLYFCFGKRISHVSDKVLKTMFWKN
jgi:hypothetical protein